VFRVTADWNYTRLFSFNGTNGAAPYSRLVQGADGLLYGTTLHGGTGFHGYDNQGMTTGYGTVFKITTNGQFTSLFLFNSNNGALPVAGLTRATDGAFYGTTEIGGANGYGTAFKITAGGAFTSLVSFTGSTNGGYPTGSLLQGFDGNFYGTTADVAYLDAFGFSVGSGTVFRLTPNGTLTTVYRFVGTTYGVEPVAGLIHATDGDLYGVTSGGGDYNFGTAFRLSVPMTPVIQSIKKTAGQVNLSWLSVAGQNYQVQYNSNLATAATWSNLGAAFIATNGVTLSVDPAPALTKRFYRVVLLQ
jgi:uncharacterized repeat protein (TIGR03803 family)